MKFHVGEVVIPRNVLNFERKIFHSGIVIPF
jgi:hypothetical protein